VDSSTQITNGIKICTRCGLKLNPNDFNKNISSKDGLRSECKQCGRLWNEDNSDKKRKYRDANKEYIAKQSKKYRDENPLLAKERKKKFYEDNKIEINKQHKEYYERTKDRFLEHRRAYDKKYSSENKDKKNISTQKRRAKIDQLPYTLTSNEWNQTKSHFNNCCCYCGEELPLTKDHFIPIGNSGGYTKENIVPACSKCNSSKGEKSFSTWYPQHKDYSKERENLIIKHKIEANLP